MRGQGARTYDASLPDGCKYMLFSAFFVVSNINLNFVKKGINAA